MSNAATPTVKHILVPDPIALTLITGEPYMEQGEQVVLEFEKFYLGRLSDEAFSNGQDGIVALWRCKEALDSAKVDGKLQPGSVILCPVEHYPRLLQSTKTPGGGRGSYMPHIAHNLLPFTRAIIEASDEDPRKKGAAADKSAKAPRKS